MQVFFTNFHLNFQAHVFRALVSGLDPSADSFSLSISPTDPILSIKAAGLASTDEFHLSNSMHILSYSCQKNVSFVYPFNCCIDAWQKVATVAEKVCLRINRNGVLNLQFLMPGDGDELVLDFTSACIVN